MISVTEATELILQHALTLPTEQVPLSECNGRLLREDLIADRDFPPFDRVTMDGIAIAFDGWKAGRKKFTIQETAAAGAPQVTLKDPKSCIEVMTGAMLPSGCDTVIRYEDLKMHTDEQNASPDPLKGEEEGARTSPFRERRSYSAEAPGDRGAREGESFKSLPPSPLKGDEEGARTSPLRDRGAGGGKGTISEMSATSIAEITIEPITQGQNIHRRATDRKQGDVIVKSHTHLSAAELGIAATVGKSKLEVNGRPKIAVVSTGDELVDITETPQPNQIRQSNAHQIRAMVEPYCDEIKNFHIPDDEKKIMDALEKILSGYNAVILSGGVSEGKYDYIPNALEKLGVERLFYKVAQRPGKPFWFGVETGAPGFIPGDVGSGKNPNPPRGPIVFALPGNPISSFMCTIRYIIPWLEKSSGMMHRNTFAILQEDVTFKPTLTYFLQVQLDHKADGRLYATPVAGHGSGDLANLVEADAFLELPEAGHVYHAGGSFPVWGFR